MAFGVRLWLTYGFAVSTFDIDETFDAGIHGFIPLGCHAMEPADIRSSTAFGCERTVTVN